MEEKKYKTFKEYYQDPEFRKRHMQKLNEKVMCECGSKTSRVNMWRHKRSEKHKRRMDEIENKKEEVINEKYALYLIKQLQGIKEDLNKILKKKKRNSRGSLNQRTKS
jgi:hypothetical protein